MSRWSAHRGRIALAARVIVVIGISVASVGRADTPASEPASTEAEHLVSPQGGAVEVPIHAGTVCILSFPEKLSAKALASTLDYEIKGWGEDGVAVRAQKSDAKPATLALATASGSIKVNVTLKVVGPKEAGLTMSRRRRRRRRSRRRWRRR